MWSAIIGGIIGLVGVLVGAWLAAQFSVQQQQRQNKIQAVLDLYSEFQSESMLDSRIKAFSELEANAQDLSLGLSRLQSCLEADKWFHVSKVIHFFEKYAVYYNAECLDNSLSKETLERYFVYWYRKYFKVLVKVSLEQENDEWSGWATPIEKMGRNLRV